MPRRASGTGHIRRLPSGRWQAAAMFEGRRVNAPTTFLTRADGEAWLKRANRQIQAGTFTLPAKVRKTTTAATISDYVTTWIDQRDIRPRTRAEYEGLLRRHIKDTTLGKMQLVDVDREAVRAWYADCCPDAPRAKAQTYALLRAVLTTAVDDEKVDRNPCQIRGAASNRRQTETKLPTPEQVVALTEAMPARFRAVVPLAAWCGLRAGEIAALTTSDLDLDNGVVRIRHAAVTLKGGRQISDPKTRASRRTIAIPSPLVPLLKDHVRDHAASSGLLFPATRTPTAPVAASTLHRHWDAARKKIGLPDLRLHDLRHFAGSTAAQQGSTLAEVMSRLGHTSAATAMRYQHGTDARDQAVANRLATVIPIRKASA